VTHTFRTDAYYLSERFDIDPLSINKVLDLTDIIREEGSDKRIGLKTMVETYLGKALNQYYKRFKWSNRPIEQPMIDYAALNGVITLQVFLKYDETNSDKGMKYYTYEAPKNLPNYEKELERESNNKNNTSTKKPRSRKPRTRRPKATIEGDAPVEKRQQRKDTQYEGAKNEGDRNRTTGGARGARGAKSSNDNGDRKPTNRRPTPAGDNEGKSTTRPRPRGSRRGGRNAD
jgi:hypothetical protein